MGKESGQYELVLETRHLLAVFFFAVILCSVFFTLGFVIGRSQERAAARAAELQAQAAAKGSPESTPSASAPAPTDLGFYDRVETRRPAPPQPAPAGSGSGRPQGELSTSQPPATPKTSNPIYLQVAATTREDDARRLRGELLRLGFPALVVPPASDRFYRVQVGPFNDPELAAAARRRLEAQGFTVIQKRAAD